MANTLQGSLPELGMKKVTGYQPTARPRRVPCARGGFPQFDLTESQTRLSGLSDGPASGPLGGSVRGPVSVSTLVRVPGQRGSLPRKSRAAAEWPIAASRCALQRRS
ncbi:hypothetical protein ACFPRL_17700 [Pseudoclavibacter helvolus]